MTSPSSGARVITATPQIKFSLRDSDSGIKISSLQLKIDGGSAIGHDASGMICTSVSGGYDCVYVPPTALSEGALHDYNSLAIMTVIHLTYYPVGLPLPPTR